MLIGPTRVAPDGALELISKYEVTRLLDSTQGGLYELFRCCALAVLNCGSHTDDAREIFCRYEDFSIQIVPEAGGFQLELRNAPAQAFVDGEMVRGIKEHLFAVLRDIVYVHHAIMGNPHFDLTDSAGITNAVFHILRNGNVLRVTPEPGLVVCWGGHSITRHEYDHTKRVGYELGLRGLSVCTGCGPGAMKGPMKGAAVGHSKQRIVDGRYIGISEPGIIAAEPPNPMVNHLIIMPDMEKRLEAFVRLAHGLIVFPGGAGTLEEILYLLGILIHPDNRDLPVPVIFSGTEESATYWQQIDGFIGRTLGREAQRRYRIILGDPAATARAMKQVMPEVVQYRRAHQDAFYFNWMLNIELPFQQPFVPDHANMAALNLQYDQPPHTLASELRRAFSGIVTGNVKRAGIELVERHGPFELHGDAAILKGLESLLKMFVQQQRMRLPGGYYVPCYKIVA